MIYDYCPSIRRARTEEDTYSFHLQDSFFTVGTSVVPETSCVRVAVCYLQNTFTLLWVDEGEGKEPLQF